MSIKSFKKLAIMAVLLSSLSVQADPAVRVVDGKPKASEKEATAELEKEAKKWRERGCTLQNEKFVNAYEPTEGQFFSFTGKIDREYFIWNATSKMGIGSCPAGSVWVMYQLPESCDQGHKIPAGCESITPKFIKEFVDCDF